MKLTIDVREKLVHRDFITRKCDFKAPSDASIAVIRWNGKSGVIERDDKPGGPALTEPFTDPAIVQPYLDAHRAAATDAFLARDLIARLTPDDYAKIQTAIASSSAAGLLWANLLAQADAPISRKSDRAKAGFAALRSILGDTRVDAIDAGLAARI